MAWSELSSDRTTWTLPAARSKNRRAHVVHLAESARAILAAMPRRADVDFVFATATRDKDGTVAITGFSDILARLHAAIEAERSGQPRGRLKAGKGGYKRAERVADWTLHDFRRTGVTAMAGLGVPPHVADRILNHVTGTISGVAAVYQRNEFLAERRSALEQWADYLRQSGWWRSTSSSARKR